MRWAAIIIALATATACTKHNARNCMGGTCTDPNFPFCDETGQFGDGANTCVAVSCTASQFEVCRGNDALVCNAVGNDYDVVPCSVACDDAKGGCIECKMDSDCGPPSPHCDSSGACVECIDSSQCGDPTKPFCDDTAHACRGCAIDDECDSKVCDDTAGTCVDPSAIVYAAPDGIQFGCGTQAVPCSFQGAINLIDATKTTLKLLAGTYATSVTATSKSFVLHGDGATLTPADTATTAISIVNGDSTVTILGLTIVRGAGAGTNSAITCSSMTTSFNPTVHLERVTVTVPQNGVTSCQATATQSQFKATSLTGLLLFASSVTRSRFEGGELGMPTVGPSGLGDIAENCVFVNANPAIAAGTGAAVRFSTFVNSTVACGQPGSPAPDTINLTDDILISTTAAETGVCDNHYVIAMPAPPTGGSNDHVITADPKFKDAANGDFHLTADSPAIDAADPNASTSVDLDGNARPVGAGRDIGAFEFKP